MNVFARDIVKCDKSKTARHATYFKANPPLPLGSKLKMSRLGLYNGESPTDEIFQKLKYEMFVDDRLSNPYGK